MLKVRLTISFYFHNEDDIDQFDHNWNYEYPEFSNTMVNTYYQIDDENGIVEAVYEGIIQEKDKDEFLKLSHHAEGLYSDTDIEYFSADPKVVENLSYKFFEMTDIPRVVTYPAHLFQQDKSFIYVFPDFNHSTTDGDSSKEALYMAKDLVATWVFNGWLKGEEYLPDNIEFDDEIEEDMKEDSQYLGKVGVSVDIFQWVIDNWSN